MHSAAAIEFDLSKVRQAIRGLRALVVDADEDRRQNLVNLLESLGIEPTMVGEARQAGDELRRAAGGGRPFAVLLFDSSLRGSAAFRARRSGDDPAFAATPQIELAAIRSRDSMSPECGPVLRAPVTSESLQRALAQVLGGAAEKGWPWGAMPAPVLATQPGELPFDRSFLVQLLGDDEESAQRVLQRFVELAGGYLVELGKAGASGELRETQALAHRLKGGLSWIGADRAAGVAAEIEDLCRAGEIVRATGLCDILRIETECVVAAIRGAEKFPSK